MLQVRDNIPGGAHVWANFIQNDKKWHIDTFWNTVQEFSSKKDQDRLIVLGYGADAISRQVRRSELAQGVFLAMR